MKLKVETNANLVETEILISTPVITDEIKKIESLINTYYIQFVGKKGNENYIIKLEDIYYFEAIENKVFAYVIKDVYEVNYKILELVEMLRFTSFIQISRTCILNIDKIAKVSTLVNGRIMAVLDNGEKIIITRVYANEFRKKLLRR